MPNAVNDRIQLDYVKITEKMADRGIRPFYELSAKSGLSHATENVLMRREGHCTKSTAFAIAYTLQCNVEDIRRKPSSGRIPSASTAETAKEGGPNIGLLLQLILKELKDINKRTESVEARQSEIEKKITEMWEGLK